MAVKTTREPTCPDIRISPICRGCGGNVEEHNNGHDGSFFCNKCRRRYPPALQRATDKQWQYALALETGEVIVFESATINGDYATLECSDESENFPDRQMSIDRPEAFGRPDFEHRENNLNTVHHMRFEHGIDVRVSSIVWCACAPYEP